MTALRTTACLVLLGAALAILSGNARGAGGDAAVRWDREALALAESLPLQDGGRIKPLDTYARFELLKLNGKRKCRDLEGRTLGPTEWLLDCLFFPADARRYKIFLVENPDVLTAMGLRATKARSRYSFEELEPGRTALFRAAHDYERIDAKERTPLETQIFNLAHNMLEFESLVGTLDFARWRHDIGSNTTLAGIFGDRTVLRASDVLGGAREFASLFMTSHGGGGEDSRSADLDTARRMLADLEGAFDGARGFAILPPPGEAKEWLTPADLLPAAFLGTEDVSRQIGMIATLEGLVDAAAAGGQGMRSGIASLHDDITSLARDRGEYRKIGLEVSFYKSRIFYWSLVLFVLACVVVALSWLAPASRLLHNVSFAAVCVPTALLVAGIVFRCVIRSRPPVSTLYETILFISGVAIVVALFIELVNRQKIALSVAAFLGALGLFLANKYEMQDGTDTMPSMIAVLDTNFWLSTHVTTVTMGYAAGLLAAAIAHVYVFGKLFGWRRSDVGLYRTITRMVYGVLCFGLIFATLGTVLGGIWANDSWGRFWGWDPKENGALLIVLWLVAVLHARLGGYIREFGLNLAAIFGGVVVAFSWFGVNLLGVGLHSYGFTSGIAKALAIFYGVEGGVLLLGMVAWLIDRRKPAVATAADLAGATGATQGASTP